MKKVPAEVILPLIKSSKVIANEHVTALILFYKSPALVRPMTPATKVNKMATIRTIVGQ